MSAAYRAVLLAALAAPLSLTPATARAEERILSLESRVAVAPDMSLDVTSTIVINVEGVQIKRGIVLDLPAVPRQGKGRAKQSLEIVGVTRDGMGEPYHLEAGKGPSRLRIGAADVLLASKATTYVVQYRLRRPAGTTGRYNELQWDVTGNSWALPLDVATITIDLPEGSKIFQGNAGIRLPDGKGSDKSRDFEIGRSEGAQFAARTTAPLPPGGRFSVLIEWPKTAIGAGGIGDSRFGPVEWRGKRKRRSLAQR